MRSISAYFNNSLKLAQHQAMLLWTSLHRLVSHCMYFIFLSLLIVFLIILVHINSFLTTAINVYFPGAAAQACLNSGRNYFGFEEDEAIFKVVLEPLITVKTPLTTSKDVDEPVAKEDLQGGFEDVAGMIQPPKR